MDDMAAGKYGIVLDVWAFCQKNGLRPFLGQITMGCTAETIIGVGEIPHQGSGVVITEGGVAVGFQYEGEVSAEPFFLAAFFLCVYTGEAIYALCQKFI